MDRWDRRDRWDCWWCSLVGWVEILWGGYYEARTCRLWTTEGFMGDIQGQILRQQSIHMQSSYPSKRPSEQATVGPSCDARPATTRGRVRGQKKHVGKRFRLIKSTQVPTFPFFSRRGAKIFPVRGTDHQSTQATRRRSNSGTGHQWSIEGW